MVTQLLSTFSSAGRGFSCSAKMAEAYCSVLFNKADNHRQLALLYLRALEPMIDMQNCSDESQLLVAKVSLFNRVGWGWASHPVIAAG